MSILNNWNTKEKKEPLLAKVKDKVTPQPPLRNRVEDTQRAMQTLISRLEQKQSKLTSHDKALFDKVVKQSKTILWNGPLGVFEMESFAQGTIAIGNSIAEATKNGTFSLVGGGDSVAAVKQFGFANKVSYVSTGGGAMLESLEGKTLPGIEAILK